jgi:hypothetical protein
MCSLSIKQIRSCKIPDQERRTQSQISQRPDESMKPTKKSILAKIHSLNTRIENLTFYCPDTLQYLTQQLDTQHCLLSRIEIEEEFAQIDEQFTA